MSTDYRGRATSGTIRRTRFDPRDGWVYVDKQSGTLAQMESAFTAAQAAGYRCTIDRDEQAGYATVEIEVGRDPAGGTDELTNEWFLLGNDLEKSLFEHPDISGLFAVDATAQQKATFRQDVEAVVTGTKTMAELESGFVEPALSVVRDLVSALSLGQETYIVSQFVLRNVIVVPSNWTGSVDVSNINKVYSQSALQSAETIASVLNTAVSSIGGYWLKKTPTYEPAGRDKWRCEREWWHADSWSSFYEVAT